MESFYSKEKHYCNIIISDSIWFLLSARVTLKTAHKQALTSQKLPLAKSISPLKLMVYNLILSGVSANACNVSHPQNRI